MYHASWTVIVNQLQPWPAFAHFNYQWCDVNLFFISKANLEELQGEQAREQESYKEQIEELKERCFEKQNKVTEAR